MMKSLFFGERFLSGGETFSPVILDSSALRYKQKQSKLRTWRYSEDLVKRREDCWKERNPDGFSFWVWRNGFEGGEEIKEL